MRVSPVTIAIGFVAALSGWFIRGMQRDGVPQPRLSSEKAAAAVTALQSEPMPHLEQPQAISAATRRSSRNLFAYRELETPRPAVVVPAQLAVTVVPIATPPPQPRIEEPERPQFAHRYIVRFGPDAHPIAAFVRDGQVITVRVGERIDEQFVLRSIGMESVEVEAGAGGGPIRVGLGTSL
jgi:hypothetical protein